jgi:hypothetical protein
MQSEHYCREDGTTTPEAQTLRAVWEGCMAETQRRCVPRSRDGASCYESLDAAAGPTRWSGESSCRLLPNRVIIVGNLWQTRPIPSITPCSRSTVTQSPNIRPPSTRASTSVRHRSCSYPTRSTCSGSSSTQSRVVSALPLGGALCRCLQAPHSRDVPTAHGLRMVRQ